MEDGENRKTHKIIYSFSLLLMVTTILLSILQSHLLKKNIEFKNNAVIAQIIIAWCIMPLSVVLSFFKVVKSKLMEMKVIVAISISEGIILLIILVIFSVRILSFFLFENEKEELLNNGYIKVDSNNLQEQQTKYYQTLNRFLYKYIGDWPDIILYSPMTEEQFCAYVEIEGSDIPILLIADKTYSYEQGIEASIWCDVYYIWDGKVQNLGQIESVGTAYPISYDEKGIYIAGGHFVEKYALNNESKKLVCIEYSNEIFDSNGDAAYIYFNQNDGEQVVDDSSYFNMMFEKYGNATVINFEKST